jgi:ABC-type Fe3+/spermidine/putrescine transport system ATPase subunit
MAALTITELVKRHGSFVAVNKLDLDIGQGEIVSILGPSGCGKTTLLRCVAGLEPIDDGQIAIAGNLVSARDYWAPPEKRNIGMVFQSYALWPHLTVAGNIGMGLKVRGRPKAEIAERVDQALKSLELEGLGGRLPSQLSGGQQQRVAVARAIVVEPEILLFDEPLSNLDARIRERVRGELHDLLRKLGITTLYVTHDKTEAMAISDRIVVMRSGVIEQVGTAQEIYETPTTAFVADFIGRYNFLPALPAGAPGGPGAIDVRGRVMTLAEVGAAASGTIGFKPEDAAIAPSPGARNVFELTVDKQTYFGSSVEVTGTLFGSKVTLSLPQPVTGDAVHIHLPPARLSYFDEAGNGFPDDAAAAPDAPGMGAAAE